MFERFFWDIPFLKSFVETLITVEPTEVERTIIGLSGFRLILRRI